MVMIILFFTAMTMTFLWTSIIFNYFNACSEHF